MFDDHIMYMPYPNLSLYYVGCVPYILNVCNTHDMCTYIGLQINFYELRRPTPISPCLIGPTASFSSRGVQDGDPDHGRPHLILSPAASDFSVIYALLWLLTLLTICNCFCVGVLF